MNRKVLFFVLCLSFPQGRFSDYLADNPTCFFEDVVSIDGLPGKHLHCDSTLQAMAVDVGEGEEVFLAHVAPQGDVSSYYRLPPGSKQAKKPTFNGLTGKFINLSPERLRLYWDGGHKKHVYIGDANPFEAIGTATYPGHKFFFSPVHHAAQVLATFVVRPGHSVYVYDGFKTLEDAKKQLKRHHYDMYLAQKQNIQFGEAYRNFTGRDWLSLYSYQERPMHRMWSADYFGQVHHVVTKETHFTSLPQKNILQSFTSATRFLQKDEEKSPKLPDYRKRRDLNMTLTVISCAPRAFEIKNFLSATEVSHILQIARGMEMPLSTTGAGGSSGRREDTDTRTSHNTWLNRQTSPIVDAIYRRAADLMQIDEALFRKRSNSEFPDLKTKSSVAEHLQLVHYEKGQQYTPHHDFSYPALVDKQPSRFATLLLYLNDGMTGGETSFPKWVNGETNQPLLVTPEVGKAVLFYSMLPDGNYDDLSQHAALPVKKGDKWLTNLWVWDPYMN